jgi:serine/threonine-protein kinase PRP4
MAKAAQNEIRFLQRFMSKCPPGIVPLLMPTDTIPIEFRGHTVLVFPYMNYNLRDVLQKFGKGVGLSLTAVRSYFGQLLAAATHLKQHNIIHSDLKPDNILVSEDFSKVWLCDFGSAVDGRETNDMVTPYLVSRFYRAPEIILGLIPTFAIDLWSLAVTVGELFLGRVVFQGITNNDMLHVMMQHMGPFSNRLIRQHLVQTKKFPLPAHFTQEVSCCFGSRTSRKSSKCIRCVLYIRPSRSHAPPIRFILLHFQSLCHSLIAFAAF